MPPDLKENLSREYVTAVAAGEIARAHNIALQATHLYQENGEFKLGGVWRRAVSSTLFYLGRYREAAREAEQSADLQPDAYERARSLILFGECSSLCLQHNTAFITLAKAAEIARSFRSDEYLNASVHSFRGVAFSSASDFDQAVIDFQKGAELFLHGGRPLKAAVDFNNAGFCLAKQRRLVDAENCLLRALKLTETEPHLLTEANISDSLGYVYTSMGRHHDAERLLTKSADIFKRVSTSSNAELAASLLHLSELHQQMRQYHIAREDAMHALKLATETKLEGLGAQARNLLSSLESDLHRYPENGSMKVQRLPYLISNNLQRNLSLDELARAVYLSPSRLAHLFKIETGASPASYVKAARMERGKKLLESSSMSVKQIMFDVGLRDESHFVRDFKKRFGLTPTQYRKKFLAEESLANKASSAR